MISFVHTLSFVAAFTALAAVAASAEPPVMTLWPNGAPGAKGTQPEDVPTITVFRPAEGKNNGAALVVCPGGGYGGLAGHEGQPIAEWFNSLGGTAVVLKYRLGPRYHHPVEMQDVQRAIRTVRSKAAEWKFDPAHIAVIGFSAGGHLASTAATHFDAGDPNASDPIDRLSSRPDLAILIYPVIQMGGPFGHGGSQQNLLGDNPSRDLLNLMSNEKQVTPQTPPTFLVHTVEDTVVPVENSILFAEALRKNKVPFELHIFEKGPHGFGLGQQNAANAAWPSLCATWMRTRGFIK